MTASIQILDTQAANQIAAGEVVERPVSVVKELVENALDAGARQVEVTIEGSGVPLIRVRDDGHGITPEDLPRAVLRHATSKIRKIEDLNDLRTLGFRGEALPSIASVSKMEIITRPKDQVSGRLLRLEGGEQVEFQETGCPPGTTVTVEDLFFNTPARRKFLKSTNTEFGQISDVLGRLALARPDVAFTLKHPKLVVLQTPGRGRLLDSIGAVLGQTIARRVLPVSFTQGDWTVGGYISPPDLVRSSRQGETLIVNGRIIRSNLISRAISEGYHTLIPNKLYPIVILNLQIPPQEYDVNVHPTKMEIRFHREKELAEFVTDGIRKALLKSRPLAPFERTPHETTVRESTVQELNMAGSTNNQTTIYESMTQQSKGWDSTIRDSAFRDSAFRESSPMNLQNGSTVKPKQYALLFPKDLRLHTNSTFSTNPTSSSSTPSTIPTSSSSTSTTSPILSFSTTSATQTPPTIPTSSTIPAPSTNASTKSSPLTDSTKFSSLSSSTNFSLPDLLREKPFIPDTDSLSTPDSHSEPDSQDELNQTTLSNPFLSDIADTPGFEDSPDIADSSDITDFPYPTDSFILNPPNANLAGEPDEIQEHPLLALRPLGQVFNTYILSTDGEHLVIIDQHAAHERINYERLLKQHQANPGLSQGLLIPIPLEFTPAEEQALLEYLIALHEMGFVLEDFGSRTYLLRGIPAYSGPYHGEELLRHFLDQVLQKETPPTFDQLLEEWIYMLACKESIKAKESLTLLEMEQLILQLSQTENPYTCPHGRPTMIQLTRGELERRFYRS